MKEIQKRKLTKLTKSFTKTLNNATIVVSLVILLAMLLITTIFKFDLEYSINKYVRFDNLKTGGLTVYYIDVGQGDCEFISFENGKTMLIDSGTKESSNKLVTFLVDYVYKDKPLVIDYMLLTHSDVDHSGGMLDIVDIFQVNNIFRPRIYDNYDGSMVDANRDNFRNKMHYIKTSYYHNLIESFYAEPNCNVFFTDTDTCNNFFRDKEENLHFYFPSKDFYSSTTNDYSPIFSVNYNNNTFLFTGDTNDKIEKSVVSDYDLPNVDFLKVAHHGSKYGTTNELLYEINPKNAIISVGENTYGHPTNNVLNRLDKYGCNVYRTDKLGSVVVNVSDETTMQNTRTDKLYINIGYFNLGIIYYYMYFLYVSTKENYLSNNIE